MIHRLHHCLYLVLLCFPLLLSADERILDYRSDIRIDEAGRLIVTETLRIKAEGKQIRRGIYREFPTHYKDRFSNNYRVDFEVISVRRDGVAEAWHSKEMPNGVRTYFGSANHMLSPGVYEYEFVFTTNRQLGFFDEHDELWWNVTGNGWMFPIDHVVATVSFPFQLPADQFALAVYQGMYGSKETSSRVEVLSAHQVQFETSRPLQPWEGMSLIVSWPKGLLTEPGLMQKTSWFLADNAAAIVLLLGLLAPFFWYHWAWNKVGRDPRKGVIIPRFRPPMGLSPAATRYVKDMSFNRWSFTAAIISLAVKGQLLIEENDDKEFTLRRVQNAARVKLPKGEQALLKNLLPRPSSNIKMDNENYREFQSARKILERELKKEYLGRLFHLNRNYLLPAMGMSIVAAIIAAFFDGGPPVWLGYAVLTMGLHGLFSFLLRAPTQDGRKVMDEIEGFKMYLDTAEQERLERMRSPALTPEVFEAFLPYAYALSVENSWCKRFSQELPEEIRQQSGYNPAWYGGKLDGVNTLNHLGDNFSSSFSSAVSSASSPPGSSSGGGGGGSSGGGGGGGGGGGW